MAGRRFYGQAAMVFQLDFQIKIQFAGNVRAFQSLVQAGANRFVTDRDKLGVLHCAASHGHSQIVQTMLELGHHWVVNAKV